MPRAKERTVPHGSFTDHWIRVVRERAARTPASRVDDGPLEPYFERDRAGPEAEIYQGMGGIVYATLADDARALGRAAEALHRALGPDTTRGDAQFLLGLAYRQLGRTGDALRVLERSVRIDPDRPDRLHALARASERAERNPATVTGFYQRALELQPALAWIRADYAHYLQAQRRRAEAEAAYRAALAEQPGLAVAAFNLGTLLTEADRFSEASDAFQRAVRLDPSLGEALAPLVEIRTTGNLVTGVEALGLPLEALPLRDRGPGSIRVTVNPRLAPRAVLFLNAPVGASLRVLESDGGVLRVLPAQQGDRVAWDMLTDAGTPISSGLYRVQVQGQERLVGIVRLSR